MSDDQKINFHSLRLAVQTKDMYMAQKLMESENEYFRYENQLGETLIHIAVKYNFKELIHWLISKGLNVGSFDCSRRTALHWAVASKNEDMIAYLLECDASTNSKDLYGKSPFHMAVQTGNIRLVRLFLQYGANVSDVTLDTHQTAFHIALKNEDGDIFELLLKNYVGDNNLPDVYGETLLHLLARQKYEQNSYLKEEPISRWPAKTMRQHFILPSTTETLIFPNFL